MMNQPAPSASQRDGFTLVEIVVAMMILSVVMVTLAGLTFQTARRALSSQGLDQRQAVLQQQTNMMAAVPYDSLGTHTGCNTLSTPFPYTRCVSLTVLSSTTTRMTVIVTPTMSGNWAPDTMQIERTKPPINPINTI